MAEEEKNMPEEEKKQTPVGKFLRQYGYLVVTALVVVVLFRGVFNLAYVPTSSMEPTLPVKSLFLSLRLPWLAADPEPEQGDIMMFYSREYDEILVKRVIGLPGQTVEFKGGGVLVDGQVLEEDYLPDGTETWPGTSGNSFTVPEGTVFLLGDNRDNSLDSRYWENPCIPLSDLRAQALAAISVKSGSSWRGIRGLL
ncbi:signal peptidase I [Dysosmobacter sp.]|uniref:signal peptidase I n=1 Tax=Dysosmobacter sp. TaxID=2591382 RepID=UPI002A88B458|nr:signal peptidase I [Dysosmobacter sp.]MDY3984800.1 signal peptidase I [Dysosmobacter sp.]